MVSMGGGLKELINKAFSHGNPLELTEAERENAVLNRPCPVPDHQHKARYCYLAKALGGEKGITEGFRLILKVMRGRINQAPQAYQQLPPLPMPIVAPAEVKPDPEPEVRQ